MEEQRKDEGKGTSSSQGEEFGTRRIDVGKQREKLFQQLNKDDHRYRARIPLSPSMAEFHLFLKKRHKFESTSGQAKKKGKTEKACCS